MSTLYPWFVPCREPVVAAYIADVPMVGVWDGMGCMREGKEGQEEEKMREIKRGNVISAYHAPGRGRSSPGPAGVGACWTCWMAGRGLLGSDSRGAFSGLMAGGRWAGGAGGDTRGRGGGWSRGRSGSSVRRRSHAGLEDTSGGLVRAASRAGLAERRMEGGGTGG